MGKEGRGTKNDGKGSQNSRTLRTASQEPPGGSGQGQTPREDENLTESLEFGNQKLLGHLPGQFQRKVKQVLIK